METIFSTENSVTELLSSWRNGDSAALGRLMPLIYGELRRLAHERLRSERSDLTLQATELVHEAYLRLESKDRPVWQDRAHFFAVAALLMRQILVDHARRKQAARHGGKLTRVVANEESIMTQERAAEVVAIDDLLSALATFDPRKSRIVELRFFAGLTIKESAHALKISPITVVREWRLARAWLLSRLELNGSTAP